MSVGLSITFCIWLLLRKFVRSLPQFVWPLSPWACPFAASLLPPSFRRWCILTIAVNSSLHPFGVPLLSIRRFYLRSSRLQFVLPLLRIQHQLGQDYGLLVLLHASFSWRFTFQEGGEV